MRKKLLTSLLLSALLGVAQAQMYCNSLSGGGYDCKDRYGRETRITQGHNGGVRIQQGGMSSNVTRDSYGNYHSQNSDGSQSHMNRNSGGGYTINSYGSNGRSQSNCSRNWDGSYNCR